MYVDASAALGIVNRRGCGKMRHVKVGMLWVQEVQENGELNYRKIKGEENPGDLMTKYLSERVILKLMNILGQLFDTGRASSGLKI